MHCVTFSMKNIAAPQRLFKFFWQISQTLPFSFWHSCPSSSFSSPLPPHPRRPRPPPSEGAVGKLISINVIIAVFVVVFVVFLLSLSILLMSWSSECRCYFHLCRYRCHHHQHPGTWYESCWKIVSMYIIIIIIEIFVITIEIIIIPTTTTILEPDRNRTGR